MRRALASLRPFVATRIACDEQSAALNRVLQPVTSQRAFESSAANEAAPNAARPAPISQSHQEPVENLEEIRARIFGNRIGNGLRSGAKLLKKKLVGEKIAAYYPVDLAKQDPYIIDAKDEARKLKLEKLKRRGKGPPKKGQGKRATKGKRK